MSEKLLAEFSKPTYEDWLELVEKQLKGVPFEKKLVSQPFEGVAIKPLYLKSDVADLSGHFNPAGQFPFIRGTQASGQTVDGWEITQHFKYPTISQFNEAAILDIKGGLSRLFVVLDSAGKNGLDPVATTSGIGKDGVSIFSGEEMADLLNGIDLENLSIQIEAGTAAVPLLSLLLAHLQKSGIPFDKLKGTVIFDPLAQLAVSGKLNRNTEAIIREMASLTNWSKDSAPSLKVLGVDLRPYHESGANTVQELSFAIATGAEYIRSLGDLGCDIDQIATNLEFIFSIGSDYFTEISKFRAMRSLWAQVIDAFGGQAASQKVSLQGHSSRRTKSTKDYHVNILRTTTEAFSAVIGGCDIISIAPFDDTLGLPDEFSRRVARNIQIVIREECHGHKTIDPAGGAWFVENLTDQLAKKAWELFQKIETAGGMRQSLNDGFIQNQIASSSKDIEQAVANRKQVIVGTNLYANLEEGKPESQQADLAAISLQRLTDFQTFKQSRQKTPDLNILKKALSDAVEGSSSIIEAVIEAAENDATLGEISATLASGSPAEPSIQPLTSRRDSEAYESLRDKADAYKDSRGGYPEVFLANMGPVSQHGARVDFSIDFLKPGGFLTISGNGFSSASEAADAALKSNARIYVVCSTDETYPDLVPEFTKMVKTQKPDSVVAVAGFPKDHIEAFKNDGVDEFIHLKANNLEILTSFQKKAGVDQ